MRLGFAHIMGKGISISITLLLLLILLPISVFTSSDSSLNDDAFIGREYEVIFMQNVTYEDWLNIEEQNLVPLRQTDRNKILVWSELEHFGLNTGKNKLSVIKSLDSPLFTENILHVNEVRPSEYRVLLEPHLPKSGVVQVINWLINTNYNILSYPIIENVGSMPSSFEIRGAYPPSLDIPGVWKIEEIKKTSARNDVAASIIESGSLFKHELWERGLDGQGILVGIADTGIDRDHSCFRENESFVGVPSEVHRKIKLINTTIDSGDYENNSDFGHGTHIAGSIACNWADGELKEGTSLSYNAKLLIQDIVSEEGWLPPVHAELLFLEAAQNGAIIHSNSWGDNEVNYTQRSGRFDGWGREVPWSLIFVAPGNSGGQLMEPANARNVIAVGSTTKEENLEFVSYSSTGPTNLGTRGIFLLAPGKNIISAKSDGVPDSMNNDTKSLSGTSMSTPIAASGAVILQQMVEEGYFKSGMNDNSRLGFNPSGPLMKALLALATSNISNSANPNPIHGWGVLNISELVGVDFLENKNSTIDDVWIWDSYQLEDNWSSFTNSRMIPGKNPIESLTLNSWDGANAKGPFLSTGEQIRWNFTIEKGKDLEASLSWLAKPEPYLVDDLQLSILTSDGRIANSNDYDNDGYSNLNNYEFEVSSENETTVGVNIRKQDLEGVDWIHLIVDANYVGVGNTPNSVGIEGNRVGFGLAVKGIQNEEEIRLDGGEMMRFEVDNVLGYTFIGAGGDFEQQNFDYNSELAWNFSDRPGVLNLDIAIDVPHNISMSLSKNPFGFQNIQGLDEYAVLPICSEVEDGNSPTNPTPRKWLLEGIWWPPDFEDCKENKIYFNLKNNINESLNPINHLNNWIESNEDYFVFEAEINLSYLLELWDAGGLSPDGLVCSYYFVENDWRDCNINYSNNVLIPEGASVLTVKWEWIERGGLKREYLTEYNILKQNNIDNIILSVDYLNDNRNELVLIGQQSTEIPIILINENNSDAYVKLVNYSWNLNEISLGCESSKFKVMTLDFDKRKSFKIGKNAEILNRTDLVISAFRLNYSWEEKIIVGEDFYLEFENSNLEHVITIPLRNITSLELHDYCDTNSNKSLNLPHEGVFLMWLLLSLIILISGLAALRKQRLDESSTNDEES
ncbi:MAG: hypothetical protein CMB56_006160 [Methanobacteriota archaeon]|nr:MAG: hypothetical protein CMB56_006160 [Euryarchaeota archaeon]